MIDPGIYLHHQSVVVIYIFFQKKEMKVKDRKKEKETRLIFDPKQNRW